MALTPLSSIPVVGPFLASLSGIKWGQLAIGFAPLLVALGFTNPMVQNGLANMAGVNSLFSEQMAGAKIVTTIDIPLNMITLANTFWPLSDTITAINIIGACWVSRASMVAFNKVFSVAKPTGKGVAW